MSDCRVRSVGVGEEVGGMRRELVAIGFELGEQDCFLLYLPHFDGGTIDHAECVRGEEFAYGGHSAFEGDDLAYWLWFYGVDPDEVWALGNY